MLTTLLVVVLLLVAWQAGVYHPNIFVDDAAISFRYVERLVDGQGLTYNDHERVQGFSNPLYCLLLAGLHATGMEVVTAAGAAGLVLFLTAILLTFLVTSRIANVWAGLLAALVLGSHPFFRFQSLGGMESILSVCLALAVVLEVHSRRQITAGILLGLAIVCKLDAAWLALAVAGSWLLVTRRFPVKLALVATAVAAPWFVFACYYYHSPLPNSLTVKLLTHTTEQFDMWWAFKILGYYLGHFLWPAILFLAALTHRLDPRRRLLVGSLLLWLTLQFAGLTLIDMGDPYPWYLTSVLPPFIILATAGVLIPLELHKNKVVGLIALPVAVLFAAGVGPSTGISLIRCFSPQDQPQAYEAFEADRQLAGIFLDQFAEPTETVSSAYGWVAFESRRPFNDLSGLNTRKSLGPPAYIVDHGHPYLAGSHPPICPENFVPVATFDLAADLLPGYSWFTVFAHETSAIALNGPRLLKVRLQDFPRPRPYSSSFGLDHVELEKELIVAPPPSGLVFDFEDLDDEPVFLKVTPCFGAETQRGDTAGVAFRILINGEMAFEEVRRPSQPSAPVVIPIAASGHAVTMVFITEGGSDDTVEFACWSGPKLIVGNPRLETRRISSRVLRNQLRLHNPCPEARPPHR